MTARTWYVYLSGILFLLTLPLGSQTLSGTITDPAGSGVPYGNVILLAGADSTFLVGTTTDSAGNYHLDATDLSNCHLKVLALGYTETYQPVDPAVLQYHIVVSPAGKMLSEVTVKAQKLLYEQRTDRLVMNVSATPSLSGNTALQVLQKAPGVVVDRQNNSIAIGSRGEVLLMIGDRVQRAPASVVFAKLEGMPAENIERIEIIHQPPAKYDAAGAAGIVRIVLKDPDTDGTSGSLSLTAGYGRGPKAIGSLNLSHGRGKVSVYGDYTYAVDHHSGYTVDHYREYEFEGRNYYYENLVRFDDRRTKAQAFSLGLDVSLSPSTQFGASISAAENIERLPGATSRSLDRVDDEIRDRRVFSMRTYGRSRNAFANLRLAQTLGPKANLNVTGDYVRVSFFNEGSLEESSTDGIVKTARNTPVEIWTGKADYSLQFNHNARLEVGAKATVTATSSRTSASNSGDESWGAGERISGHNELGERILALYGSFHTQLLPGLNGELGLRLEDYRFELQASKGGDRENIWTNVFPIVRLNYAIDSLTSVQLSANRGISRPPFAFQAGYLYLFDPTLFVSSNSALQPAFSNQLRLALQRRTTVLSLTYLRSKQQLFWQNTVEKDDHLQLSFPDNLDEYDMLTLELSSGLSVTRWWDINGTVSCAGVQVADEEGRKLRYEDDIVTFTAQIAQSVSLGSRWRFSVDAMYASE
ncbi:MAG: outer membrane beta-barrel protein, partial [Lewinella sp.]